MNFGARNWVPVAFRLILLKTHGIVTFDMYFIKFILSLFTRLDINFDSLFPQNITF